MDLTRGGGGVAQSAALGSWNGAAQSMSSFAPGMEAFQRCNIAEHHVCLPYSHASCLPAIQLFRACSFSK